MYSHQEQHRNFPYPDTTADGTGRWKKNILEGLQIGADEYIVKPFSINILKASIANLLANRALLRKKYADLEINAAEEDLVQLLVQYALIGYSCPM